MKALHLQGPPPYATNTFLLIDANEAVAIDPAAQETLYNNLLKAENVRLKYVLLTHGHHDHIASAKALCTTHGAKLIMHSDDDKQFEMNADILYTDLEQISVGNTTIKPIFTPGHTKGSVCLLCEDVLFSGDTLFEGNVGRTDLEGGNIKSLRQSIKRLETEIPDGTQVFPGHGSFTSIEREKQQNPYMRGAL